MTLTTEFIWEQIRTADEIMHECFPKYQTPTYTDIKIIIDTKDYKHQIFKKIKSLNLTQNIIPQIYSKEMWDTPWLQAALCLGVHPYSLWPEVLCVPLISI